MQGKLIGDSREAYVQPTDSQLLEAYKDAYPRLCVFEALEVTDLKKELDALKEKEETASKTVNIFLKELEKKDREIQALKDELADVQVTLKKIYNALNVEGKIIGVDIPTKEN